MCPAGFQHTKCKHQVDFVNSLAPNHTQPGLQPRSCCFPRSSVNPMEAIQVGISTLTNQVFLAKHGHSPTLRWLDDAKCSCFFGQFRQKNEMLQNHVRKC